ncbi:hypothetical protein HG531_011714 [Fusarium graminearum]|nr:hypothetical protein HG531_011714 [Fusarium graminearum]
MAAGSRKRRTRVELGIMVERSSKGGVGVAKDVATLSAVVAASEVAEVLARGLRLDLRKHLRVEVTVDAALGAITSGNTRQFVAKDRHARDVYETAVGASQGVLRLCAGGRCTIIDGHLAGL